jgi:hypothetical protein
VNRSLLFVRPNLFVVYDQIKKAANQPNLAPTAHWHFPGEPVEEAGSSNRRSTMNNGTARLHFASVFPLNSATFLQFEPRDTAAGPGIANWHLKVTHPSTPSPSYQYFLTVLRAAENTPAYTYPVLTAIQGTNANGVLVSGLQASESAGPIVAIFADNSALTIPTTLTYQYASGGTTRNFVTKLKPNTFYTAAVTPGATVAVTITEGGSLKSDAAGVLSFTP